VKSNPVSSARIIKMTEAYSVEVIRELGICLMFHDGGVGI